MQSYVAVMPGTWYHFRRFTSAGATAWCRVECSNCSVCHPRPPYAQPPVMRLLLLLILHRRQGSEGCGYRLEFREIITPVRRCTMFWLFVPFWSTVKEAEHIPGTIEDHLQTTTICDACRWATSASLDPPPLRLCVLKVRVQQESPPFDTAVPRK